MRIESEQYKPRIKPLARLGLTATLLLAATGSGVVLGKSSGDEISKELNSTATRISLATDVPIPTISPSIIAYGEAVREDIEKLVDRFTGFAKEDLSGQGYSACVLDSDCLVGEQTCVAGTKPNTQSEPGFCVPVEK